MSMYFVKPDDLGKFKDQFEEDDVDVLTGDDAEDELPEEKQNIPPMNIVILIVGSRGDVQPFIAFGKGLQSAGHRVRLATHVNFRQFVLDNGLEFWPLKGNPEHLMNFMVNHPDMITMDPAEISKHKAIMEEIYCSTWEACNNGGFRPDVLISNPPVHVHVHLAQRLQIPLVIMFTMPWSPTKDYMHPLAPMQNLLENRQSYAVVDRMIWVGLGGLINNFRKKIGLDTISFGASLVSRLRVPQVYCMSPHLAPKPTDWGPHIDVVGFWYLDLKSNYAPDKDLLAFLEAGEPPIYVGFGSIVVDKPQVLNKTVIDALKRVGKRAIVSPGWAKIGEGVELPPFIKLIGAVPHDWLFTKCSGVIHHGGAGTTAAGLKSGCPTLIVPFFGDQPFWGSCVAKMGVGPDPIPFKILNSDNLEKGIRFMLTPEVKKKAAALGEKLREEEGVAAAVKVFHKRLPIRNNVWTEEIHENMRRIPGLGWTHKTLPNERAPYTDKTGISDLSLERFVLRHGWRWVDADWVPVVVPGKTDDEGWAYGTMALRSGVKAEGKFRPTETGTDFVRTRKLTRRREYIGASPHLQKQQNVLLYVDFIEGKAIPSKDVVGLSDPFCVLQVEGRAEGIVKQQTEAIDNTTAPKWNETLWAEVLPQDVILITCYDLDPVGRDYIGEIRLEVSNCVDNKDEWLQLKDKKGKPAGQLHVKYHVQLLLSK